MESPTSGTSMVMFWWRLFLWLITGDFSLCPPMSERARIQSGASFIRHQSHSWKIQLHYLSNSKWLHPSQPPPWALVYNIWIWGWGTQTFKQWHTFLKYGNMMKPSISMQCTLPSLIIGSWGSGRNEGRKKNKLFLSCSMAMRSLSKVSKAATS